MAGLPAHCLNCGAIFVTSTIQASNALGITFSNITVPCSNCGGPAKTVDGTFDFVGNAMRVHPGAPQRTIEILKVLQSALREAEGGASDEKVIDTIARASPVLASAIQRKTKQGGFILITLLLALLASCSTEATLDWNQLVDQLKVYATGGDPYPGLGRSEGSEKKLKQRRQSESQGRKTQRRAVKPSPKPKL
jgi:hypothetical protein